MRIIISVAVFHSCLLMEDAQKYPAASRISVFAEKILKSPCWGFLMFLCVCVFPIFPFNLTGNLSVPVMVFGQGSTLVVVVI